MGTLTSNLHLMMSSFYRPNAKKYKILLEGKAFPSDHFAIGSQIRLAGYDAEDGMVLMEASDREEPVLKTDDILDAITTHKDELALVLLPGVQFYTGQAVGCAGYHGACACVRCYHRLGHGACCG